MGPHDLGPRTLAIPLRLYMEVSQSSEGTGKSKTRAAVKQRVLNKSGNFYPLREGTT